MNYRDETETLREELRQTSAELARVNAELAKRDAEPQEVEEIAYKNAWGNPHAWTLLALAALLVSIAASANAYADSKSLTSQVFYAFGCACSVYWFARITRHILPTVKVKR